MTEEKITIKPTQISNKDQIENLDNSTPRNDETALDQTNICNIRSAVASKYKGQYQGADNKSKQAELNPELLPYKEQMQQWVETHMDFLKFFFNVRGTDFNVVYGEWFYYSPKTNQICLGVRTFKEAVEKDKDDLDSGAMTLDQIFFALLHEISHFKTTLEMDKAGKLNLLAHFQYEAKKKIRSADNPDKFVSLARPYGHFYNILEDAIVNYMVSNTVQFSSPQARKQIVDLYTEKFFQLYRKVNPGEGDHILDVNLKTGQKKYQKVEPGNGDYQLLRRDDYEKGFDVSQLENMSQLSSQFLTFFIKAHMGVINPDDIYDGVEFKAGKIKVEAEIAAIFKEPIHRLYKRLIKKVEHKYAADPAKLKRYKDFMCDSVSVPVYGKQKNGITQIGQQIVSNVAPSNVRDADNFGGEAWNSFLFNMKKLSIKNADKLSLWELFNKFKELDFRQTNQLAIPFKMTYAQRTAVIRQAIEPIFSLMCLLDDSFDLKLPPENMEHGQGGGEVSDQQQGDSESDKERLNEDPNAYWKKGVEVREVKTGRSGIIKNVYKDGDGNVISVDITYFEDPKTKMATSINGRKVEFTGEEANIKDPANNLVIIQKKPLKQGQYSKKAAGVMMDYLEKPEEKNADREPADNDRPVPAEGKDVDDINDIFGGLIDAIKEGIEDDERKENHEEFQKTEESPEYQNRKARHERDKKLIRELGQLNQNEPEEEEDIYKLPKMGNAKVVAKYNELESIIRPYVEKMAHSWREVIDNIAQVISIEKDKYYTQGKIDIKKAQRYLPEVEFGGSLDDKKIKELWVEKIKTELRPKMLRLHLVIDNSGSMTGKIDQLRMAIMLLNSSLRSLRSIFRSELESVLGGDYTEDMDLVCDVKITKFGSKSKTVKPYEINDFSFLNADPREIHILPTVDPDLEQVATMAAFQKLNCSEGTDDSDFWPVLIDRYQKEPELLKAIHEGKLTDVVLQISDGAIDGTDIAVASLEKLRKLGIKHGGFAIGGTPAEDALAKRHGPNKVTKADSAEEIMDEFSNFLSATVKDEVEKPMIKSIEYTNQS